MRNKRIWLMPGNNGIVVWKQGGEEMNRGIIG